MEQFLSDLRFGFRQLRRHPGFTAAAITLLGIAIGANSALFRVAEVTLWRWVPYLDPDQLTAIHSTSLDTGEDWPVCAADYRDWRDTTQSFVSTALLRRAESFNLADEGEPERLIGTEATASLFRVLGVEPALGRTFRDDEERSGRARVAVLSHALWVRRFGSAPDVVGRRVRLNGEPYDVIGVMPPDFRYPAVETDLWVPLVVSDREIEERTLHKYMMLARRKPGVSLRQAQVDLERSTEALRRLYPKALEGQGVRVGEWDEAEVKAVREGLRILWPAAGLVFLIASANLGGLIVARLGGRRQEMQVRQALGASRGRLGRMQAAEGLLLAAGGSTLGLLLAAWAMPLLLRLAPLEFPEQISGISLSTVAAGCVLGLVACLLFTVLPAMGADSLQLVRSRTSARTRRMLVASEVALAVMLLAGALIVLQAFVRVLSKPLGFYPAGVASARIGLPGSSGNALSFVDGLLQSAGQRPGLRQVAVIDRLPLDGTLRSGPITVKDRPEDQQSVRHVDHRAVTPAYFALMGIPLRRGRWFDTRDRPDSKPVVVIDELTARRYFANEDPIGEVIQPGAKALALPWSEIIGVVGTVSGDGPEIEARGTVYAPFSQRPDGRFAVVVRVDGDAERAFALIRQAVRDVDRRQPLFQLRTMPDLAARTLRGRRFTSLLLSLFAATALVLALTGLYSVVAQLVTQRRREIGIRMVLGAEAQGIVWWMVRESTSWAAVGTAAGLAGAAVAVRHYEMGGQNAALYALVAALMLASSMAAAYLPARRAAKTDPTLSLREGRF